jgi:hypothetical protein
MNTNWCQNWDYANTVFGAGIGSRLQIVPNISLDVELLWKHIVDFSAIRDLADVYTEEYINSLTEEQQKELARKLGEQIDVGQLPSLRGTLNLSFAKHFSLFGSANIDAKIHGFNDRVFDRGQYTFGSWEMAKGRMTLYPSFSFGIKL